MCGRYTLTTKDFSKHYGVTQGELEFSPSYNVAPTQAVPVVLERGGGRTVTPARWGLVPSWTRDLNQMKANLFNARSETAHEKASFKGPLRYKRAIVPADGFYEWKREAGRKTPHYIQLGGGEPIGFAGLYDLWRDELLSCTILTTSPNDLMATLHDRMPVILSPADYDRWLDPGVTDPDAVRDLLRPYAGEMQARPVSSAVNNARNDGPGLVAAA